MTLKQSKLYLNTPLTALTHGDTPPALDHYRWKLLLNHWLWLCKSGTVYCSAWFCSGLQLWEILSVPHNPMKTQIKIFCKIFINSKTREIEKLLLIQFFKITGIKIIFAYLKRKIICLLDFLHFLSCHLTSEFFAAVN